MKTGTSIASSIGSSTHTKKRKQADPTRNVETKRMGEQLGSKKTKKTKMLNDKGTKKNREAAALGLTNVLKCYALSDAFVCTIDNLEETLQKYGVAILPNVLDEKECEQMRNRMWEYLSDVSKTFSVPIHRDKPETWKEMKHLFPLHSMLLKQFGIGQCQLLWDVRQNPKVVEPFVKLWKTKPEDLLCSFDGASFHMPPEKTNRGWSNATHPFWFHTDQSYTRNQFECVQCWVTANPVRDGDATLAVLQGSNRLHGEFAKTFGIDSKSDWYKLDATQVKWYREEKKCDPVLIRCPAGSMVFWDSRTIHCGFQAWKGRSMENLRCITYVCYLPRRLCTKANLNRRIKAFQTLRTTSHWPHKPKLNPTKPRTYGTVITEIPAPISPPVLTALGKRLVGFD